MTIKIITQPTSEPVTLDELKAYARIDGDDDDILLTGLIKTAREYVENATGRACITQTLEEIRGHFPIACMSLPRYPVQSIVSVKYLNIDGDEETLTNDLDYYLDLDSHPAALSPARYWPATAHRTNAVRVRYIAGGEAADVPQAFKTAICGLAAFWYEQREPVVIGVSAMNVPYHVTRLINSIKYWGSL